MDNNEVLNGIESDQFYCHTSQLKASGVPTHFWDNVFKKLEGQVYDSGEYFQICRLNYAEGEYEVGDPLWQVVTTKDIKKDNPNCIFIIDHAWTYKSIEAKSNLLRHSGLLERMANLMAIEEQVDRESLLEKALQEMWKYNCTYTLGGANPEENEPTWYVMDELGSWIQHDGDPNFRVVPFYFFDHTACYSLLFPIKDVSVDEEVTRNFVESSSISEVYRDAEMLPWFPVDLSELDWQQEEDEKAFNIFNEILPSSPVNITSLPSNRRIKVFTDYEYVERFLTDDHFYIVKNEEEADIVWLSTHFKDYAKLANYPEKRINQFPNEYILTSKNLLACVSRRWKLSEEEIHSDAINTVPYPSWYLPTFCLKTELHFFASYFQRRSKKHLNNHWIVKPWNLGRGFDITLSNNLVKLIRLSSTGPKIVQKYVDEPVLFFREDIEMQVKFDLRFIVILQSVNPLKVMVYDRFWIRFANKYFDLSHLEDYEKHFTVNNYNDASLHQMFCHEFIKKFDSQHGEHSWNVAKVKIDDMIREVFKAATFEQPPAGIPSSPQSKGCYGFDVMLSWDKMDGISKKMVPKLLEVNFGSDCKRACEYYPDFFNDLFAAMFLNEPGQKFFNLE